MSEPNIPEAKAVLSYATPDADGLPEFVPEAEALIDAGKRPKALRKLFKKTRDAVRYFAKSMTRRFDQSHLTKTCVSCGAPDPTMVVQLQWTARAPLKNLEIGISDNAAAFPFTTMHSICPTCMHDWTRRLFRYNWLRRAFGYSLFGCLAAWFLVSRLDRTIKVNRPIIPIALISITVFVALGNLLVRWLVQLQYPGFVRKMMNKDVRLTGVPSLFTREQGRLRAVSGWG